MQGISSMLNMPISKYYIAGGMVMPGRNFQGSDGYRHGFQGPEQDDEIKGNNNLLDFGARIYDPRLGRWLSVDPMASVYPSESHYVFTAGNPILFIDVDGEFIWPAGKEAEYQKKYPRLTNYLKNHAQSDYIGRALRGYPLKATRDIAKRIGGGQVSDEWLITNIFGWGGNSLTIEIRPGQTMYNPDPRTVRNLSEQGLDFWMDTEGKRVLIDSKLIQRIEDQLASKDVSEEDKQLAILEFFMLLGHEGVGHKLNYKDGKADAEAGNEWEKQASFIGPMMEEGSVVPSKRDSKRGPLLIEASKKRNEINSHIEPEKLPQIPE